MGTVHQADTTGVQQPDAKADNTGNHCRQSDAIDRVRHAAQFAARRRRPIAEAIRETLDRALDALRSGELKLAEREIETTLETGGEAAPVAATRC